MKILHSADLHLDSPFSGLTREQAAELRRAQLALPGRLASLCRAEGCDLVLLAGDLFDGAWTKESLNTLRFALEEMAVPVFISPGNHDFCGVDSPYLTEEWPENVHIFTRSSLESVALPALDCRIYGAGYRSMDCDPLLEGFEAEGSERYHIAVLHGDAVRTGSTYCSITSEQVRRSGLQYLALGHIHKTGSFRSGKTLCAWPGCPMGRGYDETGEKGVLIVELEGEAKTSFLTLNTPRFYDLQCEATALAQMLPPAGSNDFYRITLTGYAGDQICVPDGYPHLELRDRTVPETDLWGTAGEDTLEGIYFGMLREAMEEADEGQKRKILLAARISRQILDGQEVALP